MSKTVAFYTLGCKLNFSETSTIGRQLNEHGFKRVEFNDAADVYVINTCSVTSHADTKCKKVVREALKYNSNAFIAVIGCYAQLKPVEISIIPGVDMVLGAMEKFNLPEHLKNGLEKKDRAVIKNTPIKEVNIFVPGFSAYDRTRSFLKVQDGCDYFCSFCTIPLARGTSRSNSIEETIKQAKKAAETGVKEIVLTGVNLGDFGTKNGESFMELIRELDSLSGVERFRISSIEPNLLSEEIIHFVASGNKFMPHFHIPLQSGSNEILKLMRRRYTREEYRHKINLINELIPGCSIGVDVIAGFPGETEELFLETFQFLNELEISYLHVFPYSERPNTTASRMKSKVSGMLKDERTGRLISLNHKKKDAFYRKHENTTATVLFENDVKDGKIYGYTENYIRVEAEYDPLMINESVSVELGNITGSGCLSVLNISVLHEAIY